MKNTSIITAMMLSVVSSYAGDSKMAIEPAAAPSAPSSLGNWFLGGTVSQLDDLDTQMYALQGGYDFAGDMAGFKSSVYLEVGYIQDDFNLDNPQLEQFIDLETQIIPVTLNYKAERQIAGNLGFYVTAGAGVAFNEVEINGSSDDSENFYAQASTGLVYNITERFEVFGGVRWLYLNEVEAAPFVNPTESKGDVNDDFALELGGRFNF
jgi:Outer membrane protein beta-barrel domain